ncbi:PPC domain-containing DNA-binding protein [Flavisolibacter ginsenosidimutans]|uniref:DNA-binding protein n=1 Tax=Flavisolibacter ginsenosidimutans TaxID=661481 RepID=A0A5B8UDH2_9BACT|nr:PPC domain-containing DNA-binding protein [Flavisolibacter ginsenosidimutans]QEC54462.1 DNA-binding protein [Flavisolibacter ginsenosidimutans]
MKYKLLNGIDNATYALVFDSGDEVMNLLKTFANEHSLKAARFTAIGAFSGVDLGFFDFGIKDYKKIPVNEQVEVLSLIGDVALYGDDSKLHAHVVVGRSDGSTMGGHLLKAVVHPTLELILEESPGYLQRRMDKETGLPLIDISEPEKR